MSDDDSETDEILPDSGLPDVSKFSITDLFGSKRLNKSLSKLIDAVSSHVGIRHEPARIIKTAKTEAKAAIIRTKANAKVKDIEWRVNNRLLHREFRRQKNIESITMGSLPHLPEQVSEEQPNENWVCEFFNSCQDVGDAEMQILWSKILAGEISNPGKYSMRTLNLLKTLTEAEVHLFTKFCKFVWSNRGVHIYTNRTDEYLKQLYGFTFDDMIYLDAIGLINHQQSVVISLDPNESIILTYYDRMYKFTRFTPEANYIVRIVNITPLTRIGVELAPITGASPDYGYVECLLQSLKNTTIKAERVK